MITRQRLLITLLTCTIASIAIADRPPLAPERLLKTSKEAVIGAVVRVYTEKSTDAYFETTLCVAEIAIEKVLKGDALKPGGTVFAKYHFKKWIGEGLMPPGWNGQQCVAGGRYKVYLHGNHAKGFKIVEPNGFAALNYDVYVPDAELKVLNRRFYLLCIRNGNSPFFTKIEGREIRRILVVRHLMSTIENDLKTVRKGDGDQLKKLANDVKDLEILDVGEHKETVERFRQQLSTMSDPAGSQKDEPEPQR